MFRELKIMLALVILFVTHTAQADSINASTIATGTNYVLPSFHPSSAANDATASGLLTEREQGGGETGDSSRRDAESAESGYSVALVSDDRLVDGPSDPYRDNDERAVPQRLSKGMAAFLIGFLSLLPWMTNQLMICTGTLFGDLAGHAE